MTRREALRSLRGAKALARGRPILVSALAPFAVFFAFVPWLFVFGEIPNVNLLLFVLFAAALMGYVRFFRAQIAKHNAAQKLFMHGDSAGAQRGFSALLSGLCLDQFAVSGLHVLGTLALRGGDLGEAETLLRAAVEIERRRWTRKVFVDMTGRLRADLALVLACKGQLDEADAVLSAPEIEASGPAGVAYAARTRAVIAFKRGAYADAQRFVEEERELLGNVLDADDDALVEAVRARARVRVQTSESDAERVRIAGFDEEAESYVRLVLYEPQDALAAAAPGV